MYEEVATLGELEEGQPHAAKVGSVPICLVLVEGEVRAILDVCSHEDYPLHEGYVFDRSIECALHGSTFQLDTGQPESLPATRPVPVFPTRVEGDAVLVDVTAPSNDAPFPDHF